MEKIIAEMETVDRDIARCYALAGSPKREIEDRAIDRECREGLEELKCLLTDLADAGADGETLERWRERVRGWRERIYF